MKYILFSSLIANTMPLAEDKKHSHISKHSAYRKVKEGRYAYSLETAEDYIFRSGDYQADNYASLGLKLVSEIEWFNELEYSLKLVHISNPEKTHLKEGSVLHAKIIDITNEYFEIEGIFEGTIKKSRLWFLA